MTGLMMKDALVMRKTLRLYALFLLFYSGLAVLGVFPMSMALAMVEVIVMVLPISSFSYDEAAKWDRYAAVLPVGRTAVVKARYLFLLLVLLAAAAIGLVGSILASLLAREDLGELLATLLVSMGLGLMIADIMLPVVLSAGAGAGPALDVCHHFCPYRGAAGGRQAGPLRWDRPVLAGSAARACCPGGLCPGAIGAPGGDAPVLLDLLQDLRQEGVLRWTGRGRPCGAERRWGWRWLSSVLLGAIEPDGPAGAWGIAAGGVLLILWGGGRGGK